MLSTKMHTQARSLHKATQNVMAVLHIICCFYPVRKRLLTLDLWRTMLIWLWQNARKPGVALVSNQWQSISQGSGEENKLLVIFLWKTFSQRLHAAMSELASNRQSGDAMMKGAEICLSSKMCTCRKWWIFLQALWSRILTIPWWWIFLTGAVVYLNMLQTIVWSILALH